MRKAIILLFLISMFCLASASWTIEIDVTPKNIFEVYFEKLLSQPARIVYGESKLEAGGFVKGYVDLNPCAKISVLYVQGTKGITTLYSPTGSILAKKTFSLYVPRSNWNDIVKKWAKECPRYMSGSKVMSFAYKINIPKSANPGKYKVCTRVYFEVPSQLQLIFPYISFPDKIWAGRDCDVFEIKAAPAPTPTPEPTPTTSPQPTPPLPTPEPCEEGFVGDKWCSSGRVMQTYRYASCKTEAKVVEDCIGKGMLCENGACKEVKCEEGFVRTFCKGNALYGVRYELEGTRCVEKEELIEDCSVTNAICNEETKTCESVDPSCPPVEISEWQATGQCDEEGEIYFRTITTWQFDEKQGKCISTQTVEQKTEESDKCRGGIPLEFIVILIGIIVLFSVILFKLRQRR
ncbi:MAG: hypothetical protein ACTSV7_14895 [Candidatus Baldrarchaeia archaeon]